MENVTDALKMAGAMMIFVGAITITIFVFSKAREASTEIMAQYDRNKTFYNLDNINFTSEREVGVDAIISNLYSYYQTQNTIVFYRGTVDNTTGKLIYKSKNGENYLEELPLYSTNASLNTLQKSSLTTKTNNKMIFGLDINDEAVREEQWINGEERRKQFIDLLLNNDNDTVERMGRNFGDPRSNFTTSASRIVKFEYSVFTRGSFIEIGKKNARFIERIGEYNRDLETSDKIDNTTNTISSTDSGEFVGEFNGLVVDSSIIRFEETDETIDNSKGDKKKIIEYVYIEN